MAAGIASLRMLKENPPYDRLEKLGAMLAGGIKETAKEKGIALQVPHVGSMFCLFLFGNTGQEFRSGFELGRRGLQENFPCLSEKWNLPSSLSLRDLLPKLSPWGRRNFANAGPSSLGLILIRLLLTIDFTNLSAIYTIMTPRLLLALSIFFHAFAANAVAQDDRILLRGLLPRSQISMALSVRQRNFLKKNHRQPKVPGWPWIFSWRPRSPAIPKPSMRQSVTCSFDIQAVCLRFTT